MKIGALRRRIQLLQAGSGQDPDTGIWTEGNWVPVGADVAAAIEPLSAREYIASAATQAEASHRITIRYRDDVTSKMRCVDDRGKLYELVGPPLPDKKTGLEYLTLVCKQLEGETA